MERNWPPKMYRYGFSDMCCWKCVAFTMLVLIHSHTHSQFQEVKFIFSGTSMLLITSITVCDLLLRK